MTTTGKSISEPIEQIKKMILSKLPKNPILIAIDGKGGSGKSTLAEVIQQNFEEITLVHFDDFYLPKSDKARRRLGAERGYQEYFDWERLKRQVLRPLARGKISRYQQYDWIEEKLKEWVEILPHGIIVIEGVYSSRPELRNYYDIIIYIEASFEVCYSRLLKRAENSPDWIDRWAASEKFYESLFHPADYADLVLPGC